MPNFADRRRFKKKEIFAGLRTPSRCWPDFNHLFISGLPESIAANDGQGRGRSHSRHIVGQIANVLAGHAGSMVRPGQNGPGKSHDPPPSQTGSGNRTEHGRVRRSRRRCAAAAAKGRWQVGAIGLLQQKAKPARKKIQRIRPRIASGLFGSSPFPALSRRTRLPDFYRPSTSHVCDGKGCRTLVTQAGPGTWNTFRSIQRTSGMWQGQTMPSQTHYQGLPLKKSG